MEAHHALRVQLLGEPGGLRDEQRGRESHGDEWEERRGEGGERCERGDEDGGREFVKLLRWWIREGEDVRRANDGIISSMDTSSFLLLHSFSFDEIEAWARRCRAPFSFLLSFLLLFLSPLDIQSERAEA